MGGIGFQQLCVFAFLALAIRLHRKLLALAASPEKRNGLIILYVNYAVATLINVRIIFRLVECSSGFESTIPLREAYRYVLDSAVIMIALALYNVFHPGRLMPGTESNLPSRKVRKEWKKAGQAPQGRMAGEYLLPNISREKLRHRRAQEWNGPTIRCLRRAIQDSLARPPVVGKSGIFWIAHLERDSVIFGKSGQGLAAAGLIAIAKVGFIQSHTVLRSDQSSKHLATPRL